MNIVDPYEHQLIYYCLIFEIYVMHYVPNYYANHVFQDISKNILAKQIKLLQQLRFTMISLWCLYEQNLTINYLANWL